jgi:hypothetical protein
MRLLVFPTQDPLGSFIRYAVPLSAAYVMLCYVLRFRRERSMRTRFHYETRDSLKSMTVEDAQKIIRELLILEFPFSVYRSLEFGLFKVCESLASP